MTDTNPFDVQRKPAPTTPGFAVNPGTCNKSVLVSAFSDFVKSDEYVKDTGGLTSEDEALFTDALLVAEKLAERFADSDGNVRVIIEGDAAKCVTVYVAPGD